MDIYPSSDDRLCLITFLIALIEDYKYFKLEKEKYEAILQPL